MSVPDMMKVEAVYLGFWPNPALLAMMVELEYIDEDNNVHWRRKGELMREGHPGTFSWSIPLLDPTKRTWRYRISAYRPGAPPEVGEWISQDGTSLVLMPM
jgi:hypothetical protein